MKNVLPKHESVIENGASMYSNLWKPEKIAPSMIVIISDFLAFLNFFVSISWWDHVILTPDDSKMMVFNKGILIGLNGIIDCGGHDWPSSIVGEILLWKNAQKNEMKKNTSDVMNKIIPVFSPFITMFEWFPWLVDSRWISRHHIYAIKIVNKIDSVIIGFLILFILDSPVSIRHIAVFDAMSGHGLCSTRWNGLNFVVII